MRAPVEQRHFQIPVFCEEIDPGGTSNFDAELDALVSKWALAAGSITGRCNLTGERTTFKVYSDNFREDLAAANGSINRQRQIACAVSMQLLGHPFGAVPEVAQIINREGLRTYTAEANSAFFAALKANIKPELLFFSEYFGPQYRSAELFDGVAHQDLQETSFESDFFDLILTADVLEHIPDAVKAEKEIVRILKKGGTYCFTAPFTPDAEHDLLLAEQDSAGQLHYYAEPQYHGDPLRPAEGILVYRIFSYYGLKERFEKLGCEFLTYRFWSKTLGILGPNGFVMVVKKPF